MSEPGTTPLPRRLARLLPLAWRRALKRALRRALRRGAGGAPPLAEYRILAPNELPEGRGGWPAEEVAAAQQAAFGPLLAELRAGRPRADFAALAAAFASVDTDNPRVIEVGCGHGWNSEVLARLWGRPLRYTGLDISAPMLRRGRRDYPAARFAVADAHRLPLPGGACDVLLSGTVLMHLRDWPRAVAESARVTRRWCIFHTVPVVERRATVFMIKPAYGGTTLEVIVNEGELLRALAASGLKLVQTLPSLHYDLSALLGEPTPTRTYVCRKA